LPVKDVLNILKALSDETRLRILKLLEHGELCVCEIVAAFDMSQPKVSFHLGVLRAAGLLRDRKEGKWMHYRLDDADLFKRFLILSVLERIPEATMKQDRKRLAKFFKSRGDVIPMDQCCATNRHVRGATPGRAI
jgi:ArsR family transcriptional regulator